MKKIILSILLLIGSFALVFAQSTVLEKPFLPMSPEVMGQGGSFIANAHGYNALFYNPAGFAMKPGSLTIAGSTAWVYANPARAMELIDGITVSEGDESTALLLDFVENEITTGGVGFGFSEGVGFVGRGLGLGAVLNVDAYLHGPTLLGTEGSMDATMAFIAGLALPFDILGMRITVGGAVRPMIRISASLSSSDVFALAEGDPMEALNSIDALHGFGLGFDLGTIIELSDLKFGLSIRDFLGTRFMYTQSTWEEIMTSLGDSGSLPTNGDEVADTHLVPMNVSVGVAWHLNFGGLNFLLDPTIHASLNDVIGVIRDSRSPWTLLHIGAELKLLRFMKLRAGFNQGYITLGAGAHLLFLDVNFAFFTREMGKYIGDRPNSGLIAEASFRF